MNHPKLVPCNDKIVGGQKGWRKCMSCGSLIGFGIKSHTFADCIVDLKASYDGLKIDARRERNKLMRELRQLKTRMRSLGFNP